MCTVIVRIGHAGEPVRVLAVRDEDPTRPWQPLGARWPEHPHIVGVRDKLAGGAWLAANPVTRRLAVIVNIEGEPDVDRITSRGELALRSALGESLPDRPTTEGFHLIEVTDGAVNVMTWDGAALSSQTLAPGTHLITHAPIDDLDDPRTGAWLPEFAMMPTDGEPWWSEWAALLGESSKLDSEDDRAIIRDNHVHGYPTVTLMAAFASVGEELTITSTVLDRPGVWPETPCWVDCAMPGAEIAQ